MAYLLSAVPGMRGPRPWPSCRRPPWTVACIDAPSTTSTAQPPPTSASAPRVSVILPPPPGLCSKEDGDSHLCRGRTLCGHAHLRTATSSAFSPHSAVRIHLQRRRSRYGAPQGDVWGYFWTNISFPDKRAKHNRLPLSHAWAWWLVQWQPSWDCDPAEQQIGRAHV